MKTKQHYIYLFGVLMFFLSCQSESGVMGKLIAADKLMETYPDSALIILEKITPDKSFNKKETATHALFLTKALFKNYIPVNSDSLINIAADYFLERDDEVNKAYTYYYLGQINAGLNRPAEAWEYFREAANTADQVNDYKLKRLIYSHWGKLCFDQDLIRESLNNFNISLEYAKYAKDTIGMVYALGDISKVYQYIDSNDSALYYRLKTLEVAKELNNVGILSDAYQGVASIYRQMNQIEEGMDYINKSIGLEYDSTYLISRYMQKAELFFLMENYDSCRYYYNEVKSIDSVTIHNRAILADAFSRIEEKEGNYKKGLLHRNNYMVYMDSIRKSTLTKEIVELQRKYDLSVVENKNNQLMLEKQQYHIWIQFFFIVVIFIMAVMYMVYIKEKRKTEREIKVKNDFIELNKSRLQEERIKILEQQRKILNKEKEITQLITHQKFILEKLDLSDKQLEEKEQLLLKHKQILKQYIQSEKFLKGKLLKTEDIIKKVDKLKGMTISQKIKSKKEIILSDQELISLQTSIDTYYDNFTKRLKDMYPKLTERDLYICCLIKMNVASKDISILFGMTDASFSKHKYRIKKEKMDIQETGQNLEDIIREL